MEISCPQINGLKIKEQLSSIAISKWTFPCQKLHSYKVVDVDFRDYEKIAGNNNKATNQIIKPTSKSLLLLGYTLRCLVFFDITIRFIVVGLHRSRFCCTSNILPRHCRCFNECQGTFISVELFAHIIRVRIPIREG